MGFPTPPELARRQCFSDASDLAPVIIENVFYGSFDNPDGPENAISNLSTPTALQDDEMLGVPTWNFDNADDDNHTPIGQCGCGKSVAKKGVAVEQFKSIAWALQAKIE